MRNETSIKGNEVLNELYKFSDDLIELGPPITDNRLIVFEAKIGFLLPDDFRFIISRHNGISLAGTEVFGLDKSLRGSSIDEVYDFEHKNANPEMPNAFLPFSPDGRGNHYCLDLSTMENERCKVVFWQHDFEYETLDQVEICNTDFFDWLKQVMIDWNLEDYNYDGSSRG